MTTPVTPADALSLLVYRGDVVALRAALRTCDASALYTPLIPRILALPVTLQMRLVLNPRLSTGQRDAIATHVAERFSRTWDAQDLALLTALHDVHGALTPAILPILLPLVCSGEMIAADVGEALLGWDLPLTPDDLLVIAATDRTRLSIVQGIAAHRAATSLVWLELVRGAPRSDVEAAVAGVARARRDPAVFAHLRGSAHGETLARLCLDAPTEAFGAVFTRLAELQPALALDLLEDPAVAPRLAVVPAPVIAGLAQLAAPLIHDRLRRVLGGQRAA